MLRRTFLASPLLLAPIGARAAFAPTEADKADLARIESYLNAITTIRGKFMQVAADGGISGGKAWLSRPGNMRFEYDPPAPFLLLAIGVFVLFNPATGSSTRKWIKDHLFGSEEEFDYATPNY